MIGSTERPTAILADDHEIVRDGLARALEKPGLVLDQGMEVVAQVGDGFQTLAEVKTHRPNILFLDINMPLASGGEIFHDIKRWSPDTKVVTYSSILNGGTLAQLAELGVDGMFFKGAPLSAMYEQIPRILRGERFIAAECTAVMEEHSDREALTPREHQTLTMLIAGRTSKEIASMQGISPRTVEKHRASVMRKLGAKSIADLMAISLDRGLIGPNSSST
ncbi:MAG: response regulator transcription factor [Pseudomonadota bacterium]